MTKSYARSGLVEPIRKQFRIVDFLLLLWSLRLGKQSHPRKALRGLTLIELGPGPTRLAWIKRRLFRRVLFVDKFDFGIPDRDLRIVDLERVDNASTIVNEICALGHHEPVFLFADHCLEHLPENVVIQLLNSIVDIGATACFRVPNILSNTGKRNYGNDPTHQTPFNDPLRKQIQDLGFAVYPWMRWYRVLLWARRLLGGAPKMKLAEEVAICTRSAGGLR